MLTTRFYINNICANRAMPESYYACVFYSDLTIWLFTVDFSCPMDTIFSCPMDKIRTLKKIASGGEEVGSRSEGKM